MPSGGKEQDQLRTERSSGKVYKSREATPIMFESRRIVVLFEYIGRSSLTIHGFISGKQYSFDRPGDILEVDERDRNLLLAMPSLRQL